MKWDDDNLEDVKLLLVDDQKSSNKSTSYHSSVDFNKSDDSQPLISNQGQHNGVVNEPRRRSYTGSVSASFADFFRFPRGDDQIPNPGSPSQGANRVSDSGNRIGAKNLESSQLNGSGNTSSSDQFVPPWNRGETSKFLTATGGTWKRLVSSDRRGKHSKSKMSENSSPSMMDSKSTPNGSSRKQNLEWSKFGLGEKTSTPSSQRLLGGNKSPSTTAPDESSPNVSSGTSNVKELFHEQDDQTYSKPWWKANFFITEPVLFGTWDGVFTSTMMNIFGVIVFLRTGWMVANAGVGLSFLIILIAVSVATITLLSAVGVCERLHLDAGGIYFLLSHILGAKLGSTIGIVYAFAQAVGVALYCTGFAESIALFLVITNQWLMKLIAIVTLVILIAINVAGVKWVVKVQLLLLLILAVSAMDFIVGSFLSTDEDEGVVGYHVGLLGENFKPAFDEDYGFFTVFGVFFSTVTGVMAGINMSGDLRNPSENIPDGTFSAIGVSTFLYLTHAFILGYTCLRDSLRTDSLIQEKVALIGFVWVMGLFISSLSSSLGGLYGAPRILQCITVEKNFPILSFLAMGRGPNREPFYATLFIGLISLIFILVGQINFLGTVVTLPFLLTYAYINFAYFSIAMSYDKMMKISKYRDGDEKYPGETAPLSTRSGTQTPTDIRSKTPPPYQHGGNAHDAPPAYGSVLDGEKKDDSCPDSPAKYLSNISRKSNLDDESTYISATVDMPPRKKHKRWYMYLCNRWLSLFNCGVCLFLMFLTNWLLALIMITITLLIYVYIGQANPGVYPGVSNFHFFHWLHSVVASCFGFKSNKDEYDQMVISPPMEKPDFATSQLTEENDDFSSRGKYHQSTKIKNETSESFGQY